MDILHKYDCWEASSVAKKPKSNIDDPVADLRIRNNLEFVYREAGGAEGVERILRAFYQKMQKDLLVGFFFQGKDLEHIIQQQKSFLLRAMGASEEYKGKSPKKAHEELPPILKGHFDRRMMLLRETLEEFGLSQASITAWTNFEDQFRGALIGEEGPVRRPQTPGSGSSGTKS